MCLLPLVIILLVVADKSLAQMGSIDNACSQLSDYYWRPFNTAQCHYNPDVFSTTPQMAARYKFPVETHILVTSDGYILKIFRIRSVNSTVYRENPSTESPIFMLHGIMVNSECFTDIANRSHAFNLANEGYDVWLGNVRGTVYSKANVNISSEDPRFWNFNLDTLAAKDVRESLQYIVNVTGKAGSINYIGHSMGTTLGFMYAAAFPQESRSTLKKLIMLSPVVYLNNIPAAPYLKNFGDLFLNFLDLLQNIVSFPGTTLQDSFVRVCQGLLTLCRKATNWFNLECFRNLFKLLSLVLQIILDFLQSNVLLYRERRVQELAVKVCGIYPDVCRKAINSLAGETDRFASEDLLLYYSHFQAVSKNQLVQYHQFVQTGEFKKFDYGATKNTQVYGQTTPPFYDLSQVQLPVHLFYGGTDTLATPETTQQVYEELGSIKKNLTQIPLNDPNAPYNHIDFLYSKSIQEDLYPALFSALNGK